jgi:hypothetical protein
VSFGMPHQKSKDMERKDDKLQDFFKGICKDMKEETERVRDLAEKGLINPLPNKEGVTYDYPDITEEQEKQ